VEYPHVADAMIEAQVRMVKFPGKNYLLLYA